MPIESKDFRQTMGHFATGVAVVITQAGADVHAMTANSVTSVSLEPMLLLFCPNKESAIGRSLEHTEHFTLNILRDDQQALSSYFADLWKEPAPPAFEFVPWQGAPRLGQCLAALAGRVHQVVDGGDHWIVVGRVVDLYLGPEPRRPLIFFGGRYRHLIPGEPAPRPDGSLA